MYSCRGRDGFSMVELMAVLVVTSVLFIFAVPNYGVLVERSRLSNSVNDYVAGFHLARAEAVARKVPIHICAANNDLTDCAASTSWSNGWLVRAADGSILRAHEGVHDADTMTEIAATGALPTGRVTFDSNGFANPTQTLRLCGPRQPVRGVVVNPVGFVYAAADSDDDADEIVEDHTGTNLVCP